MPNVASAGMPIEDKQLELILTYAAFHIGIYISLATLFVAALTFASPDKRPHPIVLKWAVLCLLVAGALGGVIASNVAEDPVTSQALMANGRLEVWGLPFLPFRLAAHLEHIAFWLSVLPILAWFLTPGGVDRVLQWLINKGTKITHVGAHFGASQPAATDSTIPPTR